MNKLDTELKHGAKSTRGFALFIALIFLLVLSTIAVAMDADVALQQRAAGGAREKARAFAAANAALAAAERYLATGPAPVTAACTGLVTAPRVCAYGSLPEPTRDSTWTGAAASAVQLTAADFSATVAPAGGVEGACAAYPEYYIEQVPGVPWPDGSDRARHHEGTPAPTLYRISAWGVGGDPETVAVVQSVYLRPAPAATAGVAAHRDEGRGVTPTELSWTEIR